jgi:isopenicillin N synthase-like dioxygenase
VTPELKEKARPHCEKFRNYEKENKPVSECPPVYDAKWRFFWYIGERDPSQEKDMLIFPNVIPKDFRDWEATMNTWGYKMQGAVETVSQMVALGFKLPENIFIEKMKYGGHLLAPTGSDLSKYQEGAIFAGVHYDLNFMTIHGKSNYGGLFIWLRNGQKKRVKIPDGCLLVQGGRQLEYLTGGECLAGFHEVIYTPEVREQVLRIQKEDETKKDEDRKILWRVSSTLFSQIRQNVMLEPLAQYRNEETLKKYPPILTRDQVAEELQAISLMTK